MLMVMFQIGCSTDLTKQYTMEFTLPGVRDERLNTVRPERETEVLQESMRLLLSECKGVVRVFNTFDLDRNLSLKTRKVTI